jgi:hypothetical protein
MCAVRASGDAPSGDQLDDQDDERDDEQQVNEGAQIGDGEPEQPENQQDRDQGPKQSKLLRGRVGRAFAQLPDDDGAAASTRAGRPSRARAGETDNRRRAIGKGTMRRRYRTVEGRIFSSARYLATVRRAMR